MKRHWIHYGPGARGFNTMGGWVHRATRVKPGSKEFRVEPPLPDPVVGKGSPTFMVEIDGFTFRFASLDEIDICIKILGQKHLPRYRGLSRVFTRTPRPNEHWLNKLPGRVMKWRYRERAVRYLQKALEDFKAEGFSLSGVHIEPNSC